MSYDLFLFAGQSNMAGRGISTKKFREGHPTCIPGAGFEFRAISDPTCLYPMQEPFGVAENNISGIYEPGKKTGSMVTAFTNAYYSELGVPIIGVSAAKGGSSIMQWQPEEELFEDGRQRFLDAVSYLDRENYHIRHKYLVWCQGETDGDCEMPTKDYIKYFKETLQGFLSIGIEHCFLIKIGHYNPRGIIQKCMKRDYTAIMQAQEILAEELQEVTMVSERFAQMKDRGLMKDNFHYYQQAYNEVGTEAGTNAARYVKREGIYGG